MGALQTLRNVVLTFLDDKDDGFNFEFTRMDLMIQKSPQANFFKEIGSDGEVFNGENTGDRLYTFTFKSTQGSMADNFFQKVDVDKRILSATLKLAPTQSFKDATILEQKVIKLKNVHVEDTAERNLKTDYSQGGVMLTYVATGVLESETFEVLEV